MPPVCVLSPPPPPPPPPPWTIRLPLTPPPPPLVICYSHPTLLVCSRPRRKLVRIGRKVAADTTTVSE
ncbi:hypothetical protein ACE6H2_007445 [Prunus campanulata]